MAHPAAGMTQGSPLLLQFVGDGFEVDGEVVADEFANLGVFVVADERAGVVGVGGVDIDIDG